MDASITRSRPSLQRALKVEIARRQQSRLSTGSLLYGRRPYYTIKVTFDIGDAVEATQDANMMSGNQIVGHIAKGDKFQVNKIEGDLIGLKKLDGMAVTGWVEIGKLKKSSAD